MDLTVLARAEPRAAARVGAGLLARANATPIGVHLLGNRAPGTGKAGRCAVTRWRALQLRRADAWRVSGCRWHGPGSMRARSTSHFDPLSRCMCYNPDLQPSVARRSVRSFRTVRRASCAGGRSEQRIRGTRVHRPYAGVLRFARKSAIAICNGGSTTGYQTLEPRTAGRCLELASDRVPRAQRTADAQPIAGGWPARIACSKRAPHRLCNCSRRARGRTPREPAFTSQHVVPTVRLPTSRCLRDAAAATHARRSEA
jgi:hypothetical protein